MHVENMHRCGEKTSVLLIQKNISIVIIFLNFKMGLPMEIVSPDVVEKVKYTKTVFFLDSLKN